MSRTFVTSPYADAAPTAVSGPPPPPVIVQYLVLALTATTTGCAVAAAVVLTLGKGELEDFVRSSAVDSAPMDLANVLIVVGALALTLSFVVTGWWLLRLRKVAVWASPGGRFSQRRSACWAYLGWIVPIVNVWFPYQVVADASRGVGSRTTNFWPWWIAWLVMGAGSIFAPSGGELVTAQDVGGWVLAQQVNAITTVVAALLWWRVVRSATRAAGVAVARG